MKRLLFLILLLTACGRPANEREVTAAQYGSAWPLTIEKGLLKCDGDNGSGMVTLEANGTIYSVNGWAKSSGRYTDIRSIWKDDPRIPGLKIDLGPLISAGLNLCK